ncbi:hypothetical protein SLE2022_114900 [Rubroshorea leprosula]
MDCRVLLNMIYHVCLSHVSRESNMIADTMVKKDAQSPSDFVILYNCSADVELLCTASAIGVGYPELELVC